MLGQAAITSRADSSPVFNSFIFVPFMHHFSLYVPTSAPQFVSSPINLPASNPSLPRCPPTLACFHLSINRKSSPPLFILQNNDVLQATTPTCHVIVRNMHASLSLSIMIFAYFQPRAVAEYFLFVYSEFLLVPSRVDGWCRHILNSIPATTIRI